MRCLARERVPTKKNPFTVKRVELEGYTLKSTLTDGQTRHISQLLAMMDPWLSLGFSADGLQNYLCREDPALRRYGIFLDDAPIGVLCIRYPWLRGPYIELLGVEANHQGKGIAKQVLAWIEQQTLPYAKNVWIAASSFNSRALSAYERYGFQRIGSLDNLVAEGKSEVLMRMRIPRD